MNNAPLSEHDDHTTPVQWLIVALSLAAIIVLAIGGLPALLALVDNVLFFFCRTGNCNEFIRLFG